MTIDLKIYKTKESLSQIWFCGCDIEFYSTAGNKPFEDHDGHIKNFDRKKLRLEYICHKSHKFMVEPYEEILINFL